MDFEHFYDKVTINMKIYVLLKQPQFWLGIAFVLAWWGSYRMYKWGGRRCRRKGCGCILKVKRIHKIYLADDESISAFAPKTRKLRWWIRRVVKLTFTECEKCKLIELVNYDTRPMSLWHAYYTKCMSKHEYWPDPRYDQVFVQTIIKLRRSLMGTLEPQDHLDDAPTLTLQKLLKELFEEVLQDP